MRQTEQEFAAGVFVEQRVDEAIRSIDAASAFRRCSSATLSARESARHAALFAEQRLHVGRRTMVRADGVPPLLNRLLHLPELLLLARYSPRRVGSLRPRPQRRSISGW